VLEGSETYGRRLCQNCDPYLWFGTGSRSPSSGDRAHPRSPYRAIGSHHHYLTILVFVTIYLLSGLLARLPPPRRAAHAALPHSPLEAFEPRPQALPPALSHRSIVHLLCALTFILVALPGSLGCNFLSLVSWRPPGGLRTLSDFHHGLFRGDLPAAYGLFPISFMGSIRSLCTVSFRCSPLLRLFSNHIFSVVIRRIILVPALLFPIIIVAVGALPRFFGGKRFTRLLTCLFLIHVPVSFSLFSSLLRFVLACVPPYSTLLVAVVFSVRLLSFMPSFDLPLVVPSAPFAPQLTTLTNPANIHLSRSLSRSSVSVGRTSKYVGGLRDLREATLPEL
jgi:hypothetical protein